MKSVHHKTANLLAVRQYPTSEHGNDIKQPSKKAFSDAMHVLTDYMRSPLDGSEPFASDLMEDLEKNDPGTVMEYAIFALEHDKGHAIRPTFYIWLLQSIKDRVSNPELLSFLETILKNSEINLKSRSIVHRTTMGPIDRVDLNSVFRDFVFPIARKKKDIPLHWKNIRKLMAA
jgi:hypothetical protein